MGDGAFTCPQMSEDRFRMGRDGFVQAVVLRGASMALCSKHELQETFLQSLLTPG
jgi:hypothetical protein